MNLELTGKDGKAFIKQDHMHTGIMQMLRGTHNVQTGDRGRKLESSSCHTVSIARWEHLSLVLDDSQTNDVSH